MTRARFGLLLAMLALPNPSLALTGSDLHRYCTKKNDSAAEVFCLGYLRGLSDGLYLGEELGARGKRMCTPDDKSINLTQVRLIVEKAFKEHPELLHEPAGTLVMVALYDVFKCSKISN